MSHDLTRWIEAAEARQFGETAMFDQRQGADNHYMHPGEVVAHLPSWLRHPISHETLAAIGCHALSHLRAHRE
ncbi:MAG TPA: hypothetical protein VG308_03115 [Stellaceae bacterium]|jgi:hypothetical protein|nr:hypothetical protein [Stellaceae bacterium]